MAKNHEADCEDRMTLLTHISPVKLNERNERLSNGNKKAVQRR